MTRRGANTPPEISVRVVAMPDPEPEPEEEFGPSLNAMLLLAVILLGSLWVWLYSDWFALVSGTIGFAVLLGAVPTLRGYMSSKRNKKWGEWIDRLLFQRTATRAVYIILLAVIVIGGFGLSQPIAIRAADHAAPTSVTVTLYGASYAEADTVRMQLEPGETRRWPVLRPEVGGPDRVDVSASALPLLERALTGLHWTTIQFPSDFWSDPALLLYPGPSVLKLLSTDTFDLQIIRSANGTAGSPCLVQEIYLGEPVWLGTGGRALPVTDRSLAKWREQAALHGRRSGPPALEEKVVATPLAPDCLKSIEAGDTIAWELLRGPVAPKGELVIDRTATYPIEFAMEVSP